MPIVHEVVLDPAVDVGQRHFGAVRLERHADERGVRERWLVAALVTVPLQVLRGHGRKDGFCQTKPNRVPQEGSNATSEILRGGPSR